MDIFDLADDINHGTGTVIDIKDINKDILALLQGIPVILLIEPPEIVQMHALPLHFLGVLLQPAFFRQPSEPSLLMQQSSLLFARIKNEV